MFLIWIHFYYFINSIDSFCILQFATKQCVRPALHNKIFFVRLKRGYLSWDYPYTAQLVQTNPIVLWTSSCSAPPPEEEFCRRMQIGYEPSFDKENQTWFDCDQHNHTLFVSPVHWTREATSFRPV